LGTGFLNKKPLGTQSVKEIIIGTPKRNKGKGTTDYYWAYVKLH